MTTSNRLGITEMAETQNNRSATFNAAVAMLEAGATCFAAISIGDTAPPGSPAEGDLYVLGSSPTGAWSGKGKYVAVYYNAAWVFLPPIEGAFAYAQDDNAYYFYNGSAWALFAGGGGSGDVVGPASAIDSRIAAFDGTTGKLLKDGGATIASLLPTSYLDTDGTLTANSDAKIASQKATKTYVDQIVAANDAMVFKGVIDCSANPNYPAADRGWTYRVSVAGKIGGASGTNVEAGDLLLCLTDGTSSGTQAGVGSSWTIAQTNLDGAVIGPSSVTDGNPAVFDGTTGKLLKQLTFTQFTAALNAMTGDLGAGGLKGLVPAQTTGDAAAGKFLKADGTWAVPPGSGVTFTTTTEVLTGTDTAKAVSADALAALWEKGADVASSGTISLGEGGYFHITGTTTITDIDWATAKDGRVAWVIFDGILTLTHHATTLKLPGGANITTAASDRACFVQDASDNVICLLYLRADGSPLNTTVLRSNTTANLTAGYTTSAYSAGTKSSGTFTPDPANGNLQYATNGGAHTLAPPSTGGGDALTMVIQYTNNGSAGAITTSGFTKVTGDALTTTNTSKFLMHITVINSVSHLNVVALQ